jgi:hypothetical protein
MLRSGLPLYDISFSFLPLLCSPLTAFSPRLATSPLIPFYFA